MNYDQICSEITRTAAEAQEHRNALKLLDTQLTILIKKKWSIEEELIDITTCARGASGRKKRKKKTKEERLLAWLAKNGPFEKGEES